MSEDNMARPGKAYSSGAVEDYGCGVCRKESGYWDNDGVLVTGNEGQGRSYIWTIRGPAVPPKCSLCDVCLAKLLEGGGLELIEDRHTQTKLELSDAAKTELFAHGARAVVSDYWDVVGASTDTASIDQGVILPPTTAQMDLIRSFAERIYSGSDRQEAGRAYALSALAMGMSERDPGFDTAAQRYGPKSEQEREHEALWAEIYAMDLNGGH
ncbi:hypothetical protein [Salipiger sp. CCB-MM3]|uniref:hypothetical protein n=1 Tax=Salipiger sp. CCB-MM3 TaxID=1792508 RepID=UPI0012F9B55D|nr:hypothetical protein [Salipiger sp. CCB-MM3]